VETPGGGTRPVIFKGKKEEKQSSKEPKLEVRKNDAVLVLADERGPCGLEAIVEGYSGHDPERLVKKREFGGQVMTLGQRIVLQHEGLVEGGGKEGLAPIHEKEKVGFVPPALESIKGDPRLFGDPGKGGLPEVGLHQGGTILVGSHGDDPTSELRAARSMEILVQLLPEPFLIEKEPFHAHSGKIKPRGMRVSTRAITPLGGGFSYTSQSLAANGKRKVGGDGLGTNHSRRDSGR
jgi:hypothetical protein